MKTRALPILVWVAKPTISLKGLALNPDPSFGAVPLMGEYEYSRVVLGFGGQLNYIQQV